jgi:hypothetical protein
MKKRIALLLGTVVLVVVGAATFAAFESHVVNVKAHVEKATYTTPNELDFGVTLMQVKYDARCDPADPATYGNCLAIHLSKSFKSVKQTKFGDVKYEIYCELKDGYDVNHQITPYINIADSDPADGDGAPIGSGGLVTDTDDDGVVDTAVTDSCKAAVGAPKQWVKESTLLLGSDEIDLWDLQFYAPLCSDNYQPLTDPDNTVELIDSAYCVKGPGPDSDEYVDLGNDVKFQITGFSPK